MSGLEKNNINEVLAFDYFNRLRWAKEYLISALSDVEAFLPEATCFPSSQEKQEYDRIRSKVDGVIGNIDLRIIDEVAEMNYMEMMSDKMDVIYEDHMEEDNCNKTGKKAKKEGKCKETNNKQNNKNASKEKKCKDQIEDLIRCFNTKLTFKNAIDAKKPSSKEKKKGNKTQAKKQDSSNVKKSKDPRQEKIETDSLLDRLSKLSCNETKVSNDAKKTQAAIVSNQPKVKAEKGPKVNDPNPFRSPIKSRRVYNMPTPLITTANYHFEATPQTGMNYGQVNNQNTEWMYMYPETQVDDGNVEYFMTTDEGIGYQNVTLNDKMEEFEEFFYPMEEFECVEYVQQPEGQCQPAFDVISNPIFPSTTPQAQIPLVYPEYKTTDENICIGAQVPFTFPEAMNKVENISTPTECARVNQVPLSCPETMTVDENISEHSQVPFTNPEAITMVESISTPTECARVNQVPLSCPETMTVDENISEHSQVPFTNPEAMTMVENISTPTECARDNQAPLSCPETMTVDENISKNAQVPFTNPEAMTMVENISTPTECVRDDLESKEICKDEVCVKNLPTDLGSKDVKSDHNLSHWSLEKDNNQHGDTVDYSYITEEFCEKNLEFFNSQAHNESLSIIYDANNKITSYIVQLKRVEDTDTRDAENCDAKDLKVLDILTKCSDLDKKKVDWNIPEEIPKIKYSNFQLPPSDLSRNFLKCSKCKTKPKYEKIVTVCHSANLGDFRGLAKIKSPEQENDNQKTERNEVRETEIVKRSKKTPSKRKPKPVTKPSKPSKKSKAVDEEDIIKKIKTMPTKRKDNIPIPLDDLHKIYKQLERDHKRELVRNNRLNPPQARLSALKTASFVKSHDTCAVVMRTEEQTLALLTDTPNESTQINEKSNVSVTKLVDVSTEQSTELTKGSEKSVNPSVDNASDQYADSENVPTVPIIPSVENTTECTKESTISVASSDDVSTVQSFKLNQVPPSLSVENPTEFTNESTMSVFPSVEVSTEQLSGVEEINSSPLAYIAKEPTDSTSFMESKNVPTPKSADTTSDSLLTPLGIPEESPIPTTPALDKTTIYLNVEPNSSSDIINTPETIIEEECVDIPVCNIKEQRGRIKSRAKNINKRNLCEQCGKVLTTTRGLKYHLEKVHATEKDAIDRPFECPYKSCTKRYKNKNGLKYHLSKNHLEIEEKAKDVDRINVNK